MGRCESSPRGDEDPEIEIDPALDDTYRALGDCCRRATLYLLSESEGGVRSVEILARRIAELGIEGDAEAADVAIELRHKHLPKLAELGTVEYDDRSGMVVYEGDERVEAVLEPAREREIRTG